jgi:hypothetical protein
MINSLCYCRKIKRKTVQAKLLQTSESFARLFFSPVWRQEVDDVANRGKHGTAHFDRARRGKRDARPRTGVLRWPLQACSPCSGSLCADVCSPRAGAPTWRRRRRDATTKLPARLLPAPSALAIHISISNSFVKKKKKKFILLPSTIYFIHLTTYQN